MFVVGFTALFVLSGLGDGSTYKMVPTVFRARTGLESEARRLSGAVIGIASAVGAFGGVLVNAHAVQARKAAYAPPVRRPVDA